MGGVHYAILRNHMDILEFLLRNHAPKDDSNEADMRPIDLAVQFKNYKAVAVLQCIT